MKKTNSSKRIAKCEKQKRSIAFAAGEESRMTLIEQIQKIVLKLSPDKQREALDFVAFLQLRSTKTPGASGGCATRRTDQRRVCSIGEDEDVLGYNRSCRLAIPARMRPAWSRRMILADSNLIIYAASGKYPDLVEWFIANKPVVSAVTLLEVLSLSAQNE
ncbi:MAG: hypothetical protein U0X93_03605 [Anaerolineales bacterium]